MKILVLGGTGAMGTPLVSKLQKLGYEVYVTSRSKRESGGGLCYLQGDAHDLGYLKHLLLISYDAIVDFMIYEPSEFGQRLELLLKNTKQYIFLSSSRVYARSLEPIREDSPRLLDVCEDDEYVATQEYAIAKAWEENQLLNSGNNNWTIIRPYITYNCYRMQLGVYEKEHWLYRALKGKTIVIPRDIFERTTTLTWGPDVAEAIVRLIGNPTAYGQAYHIVSEQSSSWMQILNIYLNALEKYTGIRPKVKFVDNSNQLKNIWNAPQIKYDRLYDRVFDNTKLVEACGKLEFKSLEQGLDESIKLFLDNQRWKDINWRFEAWADQKAKEYTYVHRIPGLRAKLAYLKHRFWE